MEGGFQSQDKWGIH